MHTRGRIEGYFIAIKALVYPLYQLFMKSDNEALEQDWNKGV